jgi:hypothetical protein
MLATQVSHVTGNKRSSKLCAWGCDLCRDVAMQVSDQGEVVYAFERDFVSTITRRSWIQRLRPWGKRLVKGANYLARVAFGSALIASALVVWLGVIALMSSGRDNDR